MPLGTTCRQSWWRLYWPGCPSPSCTNGRWGETSKPRIASAWAHTLKLQSGLTTGLWGLHLGITVPHRAWSWASGITHGPLRYLMAIALPQKLWPLRYLRNCTVPIQRVYGPLKGVRLPQQDSWVHNSVRGVGVSRAFCFPSVPFQVTGVFSCEVHDLEPYKVYWGEAHVICLVVVGRRHQSVFCKELILKCVECPWSDPSLVTVLKYHCHGCASTHIP
jgi:hypothetical protein